MFPSLPLRVTREGVYFFLVLLFVIAGAVVKELNLLVMLTGMLVAPLILQARTVCSTLRKLHISRRVPARVSAGEVFHVRLTVENERRYMASWMLLLRDRIRFEGRRGREFSSDVEVRIPYVPPSEERTVSYRLCLTTRGVHEFGPIRISTRFPLGLLLAGRMHAVRDRVLVYPRLGRMSRDWSRILHGDRMGMLQSRGRKGFTEAEFYGLRDWRPGDSRRWVHWRTSARLSEPVVRQFEQQQKSEVGLLIDLWVPPHPTVRQKLDLEMAISLAASAVAELGREGSARVTVIVAQEKPVVWTGLATIGMADDILHELALAKGGEPLVVEGVNELLMRVPAQGKLVVVSTRDNPWAEAPDREPSVDAQRMAMVNWIRARREVMAQYVDYSTTGQGSRVMTETPRSNPAPDPIRPGGS